MLKPDNTEVVVFRGSQQQCEEWIEAQEEVQRHAYYVAPITCRGGRCE